MSDIPGFAERRRNSSPLMAEVRLQRQQRNLALFNVGIGIVFVVCAVTAVILLYFDRQTVATIAARNTVVEYEHRVRHEECVVQYLQAMADAVTAKEPLAEVPQCEIENLPQLERGLERAKERLRELEPNDPLLNGEHK